MRRMIGMFGILAGCMVMADVAVLLAQPLTLKVRKEDSHVGFSVYKWAVFKEEGRFKDFNGEIVYNPSDPMAMSVEITVMAASIDSRNESRDRALRSDDFFSVSRYPTLSFKSTGVRSAVENLLTVEGDLTIRGVTKHITVPVKILGVNHTGKDIGTLVGFESTFTIQREDFRVGEDWGIISNEVSIQLLIGTGSGSVAAR